MILGTKLLGLDNKVTGISVGAFSKTTILKTIEKSYEGAANLLGVSDTLKSSDVSVLEQYAGSAYGLATKQSLAALSTLAETDGMILDPVYTSKAMAGLIDLIQRGIIQKDQVVVFLHTGGLPALFSYRNELNRLIKRR